jgi:hypothetical protein
MLITTDTSFKVVWELLLPPPAPPPEMLVLVPTPLPKAARIAALVSVSPAPVDVLGGSGMTLVAGTFPLSLN